MLSRALLDGFLEFIDIGGEFLAIPTQNGCAREDIIQRFAEYLFGSRIRVIDVIVEQPTQRGYRP